MAITNASDLLVYAKTSSSVAQVTRIRMLATSPLSDFTSGDNIILHNITDSNGAIKDSQIVTIDGANTGQNILDLTKNMLNSSFGYTVGSVTDDPENNLYKYVDVTNGAVGLVATLEFTDGNATINEDAIIIEIITPGSSTIYDPIAFSTSASFSTSVATRDITNKDSNGFTEVLSSTKSFELSSESLQTTNPDTPLDGTDFFHELKEGDKVNVAFSDRIRNKLLTNLVQIGVDGFETVTTQLTQTNSQTDPFGGSTASKLKVNVSGPTSVRLQYMISPGRLANKKIAWSFYVKGTTGVGAKTECKFNIYRIVSGVAATFPADSITWSILEGDGELSETGTTNTQVNITDLSTSSWTRIQGTVDLSVLDAGPVEEYGFYLYPSATNTELNDSIFTSSWQIETSSESTAYQDPTSITNYQGDALVSSVNYDAGVEENLTCSATFTGTGLVTLNQ